MNLHENSSKSGSRKAPKGTVSLQELKDRRRFKYRINQKEYYLSLPKKGFLLEEFESLIRKIIEKDIAFNMHDNTQEKYKEMLTKGRIVCNSKVPAYSDLITLDYTVTIYGLRMKV